MSPQCPVCSFKIVLCSLCQIMSKWRLQSFALDTLASCKPSPPVFLTCWMIETICLDQHAQNDNNEEISLVISRGPSERNRPQSWGHIYAGLVPQRRWHFKKLLPDPSAEYKPRGNMTLAWLNSTHLPTTVLTTVLLSPTQHEVARERSSHSSNLS